jgi:transcription termination/antitermination protein NusA
VNKIRLNTDDIKHITFFESTTGAKVRDFFTIENQMCFIVNPGDMGLAIGKKGAKVEKMRKSTGKDIIIFEYNEDPEEFLKNMVTPVEVHGLDIATTSGGKTAIIQISREDRSRAIGYNGKKIKAIRTAAKRHFKIDELNLKTV